MLPEGLVNKTFSSGTLNDGSNNHKNEWLHNPSVWAECEGELTSRLGVSLGVRATGVLTHYGSDFYLEPRAALRFSVTDNLSLKAAYAAMTQTEQQVSNNFISLPTDLWQPSIRLFTPLRSHNLSIGLSGNLPYHSFFSVEAWWKRMNNLLEYREGVSLLNPSLDWDEKLTSGRGWAYGIDISLTKNIGRWTGSFGYGLMWNWRKFSDLNKGSKFPAKFDNRHKINIALSYEPSERVEFNAAWVFMTGNRLTLSMYNYATSGSFFPDAPSVDLGDYIGGNEQLTGAGYISGRNNVRLPAYHRLDLGVSLFKPLKNGRMTIWNFGLYNAYCHMNSMTIQKDNYNDAGLGEGWSRKFKSFSLLPIIPSVSFIYKF